MELSEETIYEMAPFAATLGVRFPRLEASEVRAELALDPSLSTLGGGLHGGAIMSLADVAGAVVTMLNLDDGAGCTTVQSATAFLRAVGGESATAVAHAVKLGRTLVHVEVDVRDENDRHCARVTQVLQVLAA